jgi:hypothetical protein
MSFFRRGSDKSPGKGLPTAERLCNAGHAMGRDWAECPYCKAAANADRQTRVSDSVDSSSGRQTAESAATALRETRLSSEPAPVPELQGNSRVTRIDPLAATSEAELNPSYNSSPAAFTPDPRGGGTRIVMKEDPRAPAGRVPNTSPRKITGILHTFTWNPAGALFVLRDGRNYGGSGKIALEGNRDADIRIAEDGGMSATHFLILCQSGHYRISDCNSTNGTFVDDKLVDATGIELSDGARIRSGATVFIFQKIKPCVADTPTP